MDLLVPDIWLKDFVQTKATPKELQKYLSLSGPTVDRVNGSGKETLYEIEVTTNRPDAMSMYGLAREVTAILPRHKIPTKLVPPILKTKLDFADKVNYLDIATTKELTPRSTAVLVKDIFMCDSPKWMQDRLKMVGERPINVVVDISNYIMHELGQPIHMFDYDKIQDHKMLIRESRKGEEITTLDGQTYKLPAGAMVIEDGSGKLIDMPGIMGGKNSAVDEDTKNVLMFVQTYNSNSIRELAMTLDKWSNAARLFEKGIDPELVTIATRRGVDLLVELAKGTPEKQVLDLYLQKPELKPISLTLDTVQALLGVEISQKDMSSILESLGFTVAWDQSNASVTPPTYRIKDITIPEDIIEEIARIYGYQNIPSKLLSGTIPAETAQNQFLFEKKIKTLLMGLGGSEVYTLALVSKDEAGSNALHLYNPLGSDTEYLRTSLQQSLVKAVQENKSWQEKIFLFEMAQVYLPQKGSLPKEELTLAGIFSRYHFREAKGVLEVFMDKLNISGTKFVDQLHPIADTEYYFFAFKVEELAKKSHQFPTFTPMPQFPPQIEDVTLLLPFKSQVGEIMQTMLQADKRVRRLELREVYKDAYTFRVYFQDDKKTLNNQEVSAARNVMLREAHAKHGVKLKE